MNADDPTHTRPPTGDHDVTRHLDPSDAALDAGLAAAFGGETTHHRPPAAEPEAGTVIDGKYRLSERIGVGGMGSVWVAHQSEPVKRKVAIKLIKLGMDSKAVLARFDAERQALAVMDHPNIAKVLDGGLHDGRPYFAMELVKGVPITQFCDERKLTPQQRLELFVPICQAIQHAHQKGVIHRDIKPANVLIALYDDKPVPKVIDFGVAKATGAALTEHTLETGFGAVVGTPAYMSPEQASLNNLDIDTRSDVYSLGILLYELLTGSPPFTRKELEKKGLLEILRVVREEEPPRPSNKLSTADALPTLSANRGTEPKALTGLLRNELDWIVMKALEKDRARRYDTANGFAADVLRYLSGEAVQAHPPSTAYRVTKFVRRHKGQVLAASLVLFALVTGIAGTTWGLIRADKAWRNEEVQRQEAERRRDEALAERKRADREAALAKATDEFLISEMLMAGDPNQTRGQKVTIDDVLQRAASNVAKAFADQPEVEVGIRDTLATVFVRLGKCADARKQVTAAIPLHVRLHGEEEPRTLVCRNILAEILAEEGEPAEAERVLREILTSAERTLGERHQVTLSFQTNLAAHLWRQHRYTEAIPLTRRTYEIQRNVLGPESQSTLVSLLNLGVQLRDAGQVVEAEPIMLQALNDCERSLGGTHPTTISAMNNVASLRTGQGKLAEAEQLYRRVVVTSREALSKQHPKTVMAMNSLAGVLLRRGELAEAEAEYRRVLDIVLAHYPAGHAWLFGVLENLATICERQGKLADAEQYWREFYQAAAKPPGGINTRLALRVQAEVARVMSAGKKWAEAEVWYETALTLQTETLGAGHSDAQLTRSGLAAVYVAQQKWAEAEPVLRDWLKHCPKLAPPWWRESDVSIQLAECLLAQKKFAQAEPLLLKGYEELKQCEKTIPPQGGTRIPEALDRLIQLYTAMNKPDEVKKWRAERATYPRETLPSPRADK